MFQLFSKGIPASQVQLIESNRDRIQAWFDNTPSFHQVDAVHRSGVKLPRFILCWGGTRADSLALNTQFMSKDYRKHAKNVSFIFWDNGPADIQACLMRIKIPDICMNCGETRDLKPSDSNIFNVRTIPDTTSYYNIHGNVVFRVKHCPKCKISPLSVRVAYQKETHFLTVSLSGVNSRDFYHAVVENNAENMVPFFRILAWRQLRENDLVDALRKQR